MSIEQWLGTPEHGIVRTVRPAQIRLATIIEATLKDGGKAMVEAATGTGKSLAALVPAIGSGKRVVISTAKKTLQQQMRDVDIPRLQKKLPVFTSAILKGKSNYACRLRYEELKQRGGTKWVDPGSLEEFESWLYGDPYGDLSDGPQLSEIHSGIRVTECVARQCHHAEDCGYRRIRGQAETAKLLVVNHALLAYDLALGGTPGQVLGAYDAVIIDEAHQAPSYFREALTCKIDASQVTALKRVLENTVIRMPEELGSLVQNFMRVLPERGVVLKNDTVVNAALRVRRSLVELREQFIYEGLWSPDTAQMRETAMSAKDINRLRAGAVMTQRMLRACDVCVDKLDTKYNEDGQEVITPDSYVTYVNQRLYLGEPMREFVVAPVEVGPFVRGSLNQLHACVFMSATLSTSGHFNYMAREFGVKPEDVEYKEVLPHAFNYATQSCLYVSSKIPEYKRDTQDDYWRAALDEMHTLLEASEGGAFVLCASNSDVKRIAAYLDAQPTLPFQWRAQDGDIDAAVAWFKEGMNNVLVGTKSLWEGVDVPGLRLRLVVIPRLPFPTPDDAVFFRKKQKFIEYAVSKGGNQNAAELTAWRNYDLQAAMIDLKQGAGRLIRHEKDRGVVAVLDRRMYGTTKGYSRDLRAALPHPPTSNIGDVCALLKGLGKIASTLKK